MKRNITEELFIKLRSEARTYVKAGQDVKRVLMISDSVSVYRLKKLIELTKRFDKDADIDRELEIISEKQYFEDKRVVIMVMNSVLLKLREK